jgi:hypothetical protein
MCKYLPTHTAVVYLYAAEEGLRRKQCVHIYTMSTTDGWEDTWSYVTCYTTASECTSSHCILTIISLPLCPAETSLQRALNILYFIFTTSSNTVFGVFYIVFAAKERCNLNFYLTNALLDLFSATDYLADQFNSLI